MPIEDQLDCCINDTKVLISDCREMTGRLITCQMKQKDELASELETTFGNIDESLNKLDRLPNQVKTEAANNISKISHKPEQTKGSKDYYLNELTTYQTQTAAILTASEEKSRKI